MLTISDTGTLIIALALTLGGALVIALIADAALALRRRAQHMRMADALRRKGKTHA